MEFTGVHNFLTNIGRVSSLSLMNKEWTLSFVIGCAKPLKAHWYPWKRLPVISIYPMRKYLAGLLDFIMEIKNDKRFQNWESRGMKKTSRKSHKFCALYFRETDCVSKNVVHHIFTKGLEKSKIGGTKRLESESLQNYNIRRKKSWIFQYPLFTRKQSTTSNEQKEKKRAHIELRRCLQFSSIPMELFTRNLFQKTKLWMTKYVWVYFTRS